MSGYGPWEPCSSIHQRFQRAKGVTLAAVVDSVYVLPGSQQRPLSWVHPDGSPALRRHPLNNREQHTVVEEFASVILEKGVQEDQRDAPVAVLLRDPQDSSKEHWCFLATATMVEAFFVAKARDPGNENSAFALAKRLDGGQVT